MSNNRWEFEPSQNDLQNLREWLKKTPHIVQDYDDKFLAAFVRGCKGSLQKTKSVLEHFNALGQRYPYLLGDLDPFHPRLQEHLSVSYVFPMPKKLEDGTVLAIAVRNLDKDDPSKLHVLELIRYFIIIYYIHLWEDNCGPCKFVLILDGKGLGITSYNEVTPVFARDLIRILQTSLPVRPKGIHILNLHPAAAAIFNFLKTLAPDKLKNRMHFHSSMETLYEHIPKEKLPMDYEGSEETFATLSSQWWKKIQSFRDRLIEENVKMRRLDRKRPNQTIWMALTRHSPD